MPICNLQFHLPEEREDLEIAQNGIKYQIALQEIDRKLRDYVKYQCEEFSEPQMEMIEKIREDFFEILKDNEIIDKI